MAGKGGGGKGDLAVLAAGLMRRRRRLDEEEERERWPAKGRAPQTARAAQQQEGAGWQRKDGSTSRPLPPKSTPPPSSLGKGARAGGPKPPSQPPPAKLLSTTGPAPAKARPTPQGKGPIAPMWNQKPTAGRTAPRQPARQEEEPPQRKLPSKAKKSPAWEQPTKQWKQQSKPWRESAPPPAGEPGFPRDTMVACTLLEDSEVPELLDGLTIDGWAYSFDGKKQALCQQVDQYLEEVVGGDEGLQYSEGNNQEDDSWDKFPEVGAALQAAVPEVDECFCIAVCRPAQVWAVGVSAKGRNRYYAARVALALRLHCAALEVEGETQDLSSYPALEEVLSTIGPQEEEAEEPPKKRSKTVPSDAVAAEPRDREATNGTHQEDDATEEPAPRNTPFFITINDNDGLHEKLEAMPLEGLAVAASKNPGRLYENLNDVVSLFAEESEIEYLDDPDWSKLPEVGAAIRRVYNKEEQLCVAVCPTRNVWAVGLAARGMARWMAAKLAIATSLALQVGDELDPDLSASFPEFVEFVETAKTAMTM